MAVDEGSERAADGTPGADTEADTADVAAHDAARLRGPKRLLLIGPPVSFVLAFSTSAVGADGRAGLVLLLLLLAVVFALTGLWLAVHLLVDQFRGDPTSVPRGLLAFVMFLATLVSLISFAGVVSSAGGGT